MIILNKGWYYFQVVINVAEVCTHTYEVRITNLPPRKCLLLKQLSGVVKWNKRISTQPNILVLCGCLYYFTLNTEILFFPQKAIICLSFLLDNSPQSFVVSLMSPEQSTRILLWWISQAPPDFMIFWHGPWSTNFQCDSSQCLVQASQ